MSVLAGLLDEARAQAGLDGALADGGDALHGGRRLPARGGAARGARRRREAGRRGRRSLNDTFAVLRAGTEQGWGVAVVCGAGINCVGVAPDGRHVRFPALGAITGDWGGGYDVGLAAVSKAARSFDGRGPKTTLEQRGARALRLRDAVRAGRGDPRASGSQSGGVLELPPVVFAEAEHDEVAAGIVDQLADEVVALAGGAARLDLRRARRGSARRRAPAGGEFAGGRADPRRAARRRSRVTGAPPIVGAALLALDEVGRGRARRRRAVRAELAEVADG